MDTILKGFTKKQYENIFIDTEKFDREIIEKAVRELQTIKSIDNLPILSTDYSPYRSTYNTIRLGKWVIQCDKTGIRIEEWSNHTIAIPDIPYDKIKEISFDTYIDKSFLVGVWITLLDDSMYRVLTYYKK